MCNVSRIHRRRRRSHRRIRTKGPANQRLPPNSPAGRTIWSDRCVSIEEATVATIDVEGLIAGERDVARSGDTSFCDDSRAEMGWCGLG